MDIEVMNMCMVHNIEKNEVLVLDKVKKAGWEGLCFPGGHLELGESIYDSTIREVYEETGLRVDNLEFRGLIHWENPEKKKKDLGFLYYTQTFSGRLVEVGEEGEVFWMDFDDFIEAEAKADSMEDFLKVYLSDDITEAMAYYGKLPSPFEFY